MPLTSPLANQFWANERTFQGALIDIESLAPVHENTLRTGNIIHTSIVLQLPPPQIAEPRRWKAAWPPDQNCLGPEYVLDFPQGSI